MTTNSSMCDARWDTGLSPTADDETARIPGPPSRSAAHLACPSQRAESPSSSYCTSLRLPIGRSYEEIFECVAGGVDDGLNRSRSASGATKRGRTSATDRPWPIGARDGGHTVASGVVVLARALFGV